MSVQESPNKPILTIAIPVYNEEKTIEKILKETTSLGIKNYEVMIVDDSSKDSSLKIIKDFVAKNEAPNIKIKILEHRYNRGKGAGIKTALAQAKGEYFIIQDADLEYKPREILKILRKAKKQDLDVVYGSRFKGKIKNMALANYVANLSYNFLLRLLYRTKITDMHTCYKMVRTSLFKRLEMNSQGFGYASELVSNLLKRGIEVSEVPISFNGRKKDEGKKIDFIDGIECYRDLLYYRFKTEPLNRTDDFKILVKFIFVGLAGFLTNYIILWSLTFFYGLSKVYSQIIGAIVAIQVTFLLHDIWTYKIENRRLLRWNIFARYFSYILSNSAGSIMTVLLFAFFSRFLGILQALIISATIAMIWNYYINRLIIWRSKKKIRALDLKILR